MRLTEAIQRGLLLHDRVHDGAAREQVSQGIRDRLREVRPQLNGAEQQTALAIVDRTVTDYLRGRR